MKRANSISKLIVKYNYNGDMTVLVVHSVVNYNVPYDEVAVWESMNITTEHI